MELPLISVVTVVYNGGSTLEKSITSVITQTYPNIDYVIIDGGSTDDTIDLIKKYGNKISFWISEKDRGIYDAMNKGIHRARGEWIYFLGSDDYLYDANVLERVAVLLQVNNCDFLYGNVLMGSEKKPYDGLFNFHKLLRCNISHQSIFFKKHLFTKMGDYNLRYKIYSDWDFNIRCFRKGDVKITYSNIIVAHFIMGGASANYDLLFLRECILPLRMEELDTKQVGLENIKVYDEWWRLLRNANIRSLHELYKYVDKEKTPNQIKGMVIWQSKIPSTVLKMGFFSKGCMALNYFFTHRRNSS